MDNHQTRQQLIALWLSPTPVEITVYMLLTALTFFLSSQSFIDQILFATGDFNPIRAGIGGVDLVLQRIIGEKLAGSLSLAVFWASVGLIVNLFWWIGSNFSTELNNNLLYSRYVHPKDVSPRAQLEDFIKRTVVRTVVAIIGLIYFNYVLSTGLKVIANRFSSVTELWSVQQDWGLVISTVLIEMLMLHLVVVITRLVLLRSKVFATE